MILCNQRLKTSNVLMLMNFSLQMEAMKRYAASKDKNIHKLNKVCDDLDSTVQRARNVAAPATEQIPNGSALFRLPGGCQSGQMDRDGGSGIRVAVYLNTGCGAQQVFDAERRVGKTDSLTDETDFI